MTKPPPIGRFSGEAIDSLLEAVKHTEDTSDHFHRVLAQLPLTLAVFLGADHTLEVSTPSAQLLYGCETHGRPARECVRGDAIARGMLAKLDETYVTGSDSLARGERIVVPTQAGAEDEELIVDTHYKALKRASGEVYGVLVASVDVTREARARQYAEQERQRLARVLDQAPFAVAITSGPHHILRSANERQMRQYGNRPTLNLSARAAFPEPELEPVHATFDRAFQRNETVVMREQRIGWDRTGSGETDYGYFDLIYQPITDENGNVEGLLCVSTDVTESVEARLVVTRARAEAEAAKEALERAHAQLELRIAERTAQLKQSNAALASEIATRNHLQRRLNSAREDEQRRAARDLHDQVGQTLSALTLTIKAACEAATLPPATLCRLEEALRLAGILGRDIHELATRLRPAVLDAFGLHAALRQLLADWSHHCGVAVDLEAAWLKSKRLAADIETTLYRVTQEALTNVARHAQATHVSVVVESNAGNVIAVIEDNGRGFDLAEPEAGRMGIEGMRERVMLVGGTFDIESAPGAGTTVFVSIPVASSEA